MALSKPERPIGAARRNQPDERPTAYARKDRKRWCGGHVGREHVLEIVLREVTYQKVCVVSHLWMSCLHQERCTKCGKITRFALPTNECPTINAVV